MKKKFFTLIALFALSLSAMAQGYHMDRETRRILDEADRVVYEAERSTRFDRNGRPVHSQLIRYIDRSGRPHKVNRDAFGNYYDYSSYSCYENATNTHRNPRYSGYYPSNGYYNGRVYIGTENRRYGRGCNDGYCGDYDNGYYGDYDNGYYGDYDNGYYGDYDNGYCDRYDNGCYNNGYRNNGYYNGGCNNGYRRNNCGGGSMSQAQAQSMSNGCGSMAQAQAQAMSMGGMSMSQSQSQSMSSSSCNNNINFNNNCNGNYYY